MLRTAFMGTPDFSVPSLDVLAEKTEVVAVFCQPDRRAGRGKKVRHGPVKTRALELGLEVLQPRTLRGKRSRGRLRELAPELLVVAAYGLILPADLLAEPRLGAVNVHASLLPALRGAAPLHRAVLEGHDQAGVCIMQMTEGLDEGPVFLRRAEPLGPEVTTGEVHDRMAKLGAEALGEYLDRVAAGEDLVAEPQPEEGITYAEKVTSAEAQVDFSRPAQEVDRLIRGMSPWPGAFTEFRGKRLVLLRSRLAEGAGEPGTVLATTDAGLRVACGQGAVEVTQLKPAGKRAMAAADWARGARLEEGERLGAA